MNPLRPIGLYACCVMIASCAASRSSSLAAAPRIEMPPSASGPCTLPRLPQAPTEGDLERGYAQRGAELVACEGARSLAVAIHEAEHRLEDEQLRAREARRRGWWSFWR